MKNQKKLFYLLYVHFLNAICLNLNSIFSMRLREVSWYFNQTEVEVANFAAIQRISVLF
jgi:hypothetical protein